MLSAAQLGVPDAVLFAHAFLGEFFAAHPDVHDSCQVLIGCPTGCAEARAAYLRFLRTSDLQVALLPESQSALVHVWDLRRRQPVADGQPSDVDNVLVLDIGSSTVDVTMVTDLEPVNIEVGTELGCADIDRELADLAQTALAADPAFQVAMMPDDAAALLRMACRRAKEAQFTGQELLLHDRQDCAEPDGSRRFTHRRWAGCGFRTSPCWSNSAGQAGSVRCSSRSRRSCHTRRRLWC